MAKIIDVERESTLGFYTFDEGTPVVGDIIVIGLHEYRVLERRYQLMEEGITPTKLYLYLYIKKMEQQK